jgi:virginiamycin B lyase
MRRHRWVRRCSAVVAAATVVVSLVGVTPRTARASISRFVDARINLPTDVVSGPDGALWFTIFFGNSIGRITTSGVVTTFTDPTISHPQSIESGPDGALWFTNSSGDSLGRITTDGTVTNFRDPGIQAPRYITNGPDGALWFTNDNPPDRQTLDSIGRITTSGVVTYFPDPTISDPRTIAPGPDGALWFSNQGNNSIGRITTSGTVTNFTDPTISVPYGIVTGPDGALWFGNLGISSCANCPSTSSIGRITTSGTVTNFDDPGLGHVVDIVPGPDGALWFTNSPSIGRITTSGSITIFTEPDFLANDDPLGITVGPDGALWFAENSKEAIGRLEVPTAHDSCSVSESCMGSAGVAASASSPLESNLVTGQPDFQTGSARASAVSKKGSVTLTGSVKLTRKKPGTLTCPNTQATKSPVTSLTSVGYSRQSRLRLTVTLRQVKATNAAQVCYHAPKPFKSQSAATSKPGGGSGLLLTCKQTNNVAPCVLSTQQVKTSIVVVFYARGGDTTYTITWQTNAKTTWSTRSGNGIEGKAFKGGFVVQGLAAPYHWTIKGSLPPGITFDSNLGKFSGTPTATGRWPVTAQVANTHNVKSKAQKFTIRINPPPNR